MTNPKKNGDLMLRGRYDSGAELAGPAVITDEKNMLVSLGGAASMLVRRADGSLPLNEAADRYESWLNRVRRNAIEDWVDSLPERESTRLHRRYLDRDGAGRPEEEGDA